MLSRFSTQHIFFTLLCFGIFATFSLIGPTPHAAAQEEEDETLVVVTKIIPPFVMYDGERYSGFSVDIMKEIQIITGLKVEIIQVETVTEQLDAVISGEADLAVAAISMTPDREELVDFSYPYYTSGLQIMAASKPASTFSRLLSFLTSSRFLLGILVLFLIILLIGHVVWLLERGKNPDFPQSYLPGVWEGLWWAAVTVTTVGYGDKKVRDKWGRLLAMFWMFSGLFLIANFTAYVTAETTVYRLESNISGIDDLPGKRVLAITGTTSAEYLRKEGIPFQEVETTDKAFEIMKEKLADAFVYDAPVLQYYLHTNPTSSFLLVGTPFNPEDYGIAMQPGSPYEETINKALLEIGTNGTFEEIANRWAISE